MTKIERTLENHNVQRYYHGLVLPILATFFIVLAGCSHGLRITNKDQYFPPPPPAVKNPVTVGITSPNFSDVETSRYLNAIVDSMKRNSSVENVIYPYSQARHADQVDITVDITIKSQYSGQGSNFFVNFPGGLIWAPAVWGYGYNAEIETTANITHLREGHSQQIVIPVKYKFRQAEFDRTWTEIGWLAFPPGFGVIPFIGGLIFTKYDPDVTDEFITKVSSNYGEFITGRIVAAF